MTDKPIRRAHCLIATVEGDTLEALCYRLESLRNDLIMGRLTIGCAGGFSCGMTYEYLHDPDMTHDRYLEAIDAHLTAQGFAKAVAK